MNPRLRKILTQTSRSFGLSVRLLPRSMRQPIGIAYLCARLSDTIADEGSLPAAERLELLARLGQLFQSPSQVRPEIVKPLLKLQSSLRHSGEAQLLAQLPKLLEELAQEQLEVQQEIQAVLSPILIGQRSDIERFESLEHDEQGKTKGNASTLRCLNSEQELLEYCWQVAGCVGEFWGKLGQITSPESFPSEEKCPQLKQLGASYGQALQLINILRDLPKDAQLGRCYLPGAWTSGEQAWQEASPHWLDKAREKLQTASSYCAELKAYRLRLATALPAAIGWKTLLLLDGVSYAQLEVGMKIPRAQVYQLLRQAIRASRSQASIEIWLKKLSQP